MNVELKKHPREGLKYALSQYLVSKDRRWKRETQSAMLTVMWVYRDIGLIDEGEWAIWRWVLDAAEAFDDRKRIGSCCPGCEKATNQFRCDKCRKAILYHPGCLPEMATDGHEIEKGPSRGEVWCATCVKVYGEKEGKPSR